MNPSSSIHRVGPYRLLGELGRGGMGTVYRAVRDDDTFHKEVALKLVRPGLAAEPVLRRFRAEGQILARLEHPNIATLFDGGTTDDGRPYLVMELVRGQALDDYCADRALGVPERLALFRKICAAVHYLHQNLIVHRDLKPHNVLVTSDGVPKILDFGIAKLLAGETSGATLTATLLPAMTPEYASPEQVTGSSITTASDVYSLGVVLYELLTGRRPYEITSTSPEEVVRAVCRTEPRKPSLALRDARPRDPQATLPAGKETRGLSPADLAGDLDTIVMKALRKEPERRYVSAHDLAEDLRRHLEGKPVLARGDALGYRVSRFVRSHRSLAAGAPLLVLTLAFGFLAAAREARRAEANRVRAERRFEDARRLANSLVFEVHDAIENLPGATAARALLLQRASQHLDALATDAPANPELAEELAVAYHKLANVQGTQGTANLGDRQAALLNHRKGLAIRKTLQADSPSDPEKQARLIESLVTTTFAEQEVGPSLEHAKAAVGMAESLVGSWPHDRRYRHLLAQAHYTEGSQYRDIGDNARALESFEKAAPLFEEVSRADPGDGEARRGLARCQKRIGAILIDRDEPQRALPYLRRAVAEDEARLAAGREVVGLRRDVSVSRTQLGFALLHSGDPAGALRSFEEALRLREEIVRADSRNADAPNDVASALWYIGQAQIALGRWDAAIASLRRAAPLAARPRNDRDDLFASIHAALADAHEGAGRLTEALGLRRQSLGLRLRLLEGKPEVPKLRRAVLRDTIALGATLARLAERDRSAAPGHWQEARKAYAEGLRLAAPLESAGSSNKRDIALRETLEQGLARCDHALSGRGDPQLTARGAHP